MKKLNLIAYWLIKLMKNEVKLDWIEINGQINSLKMSNQTDIHIKNEWISLFFEPKNTMMNKIIIIHHDMVFVVNDVYQ
ncbi:hypothetical protein KOL64_20185 [Providencia rettgeri]|nr:MULTISPECIES: hypothetical protein [Providencia]WJM88194.1 hypothetical protein KOL64_20185 [Providencia rettgeri]